MLRLRCLLVVVTCLGLTSFGRADEEEKDPLAGIKCPVSDEQVTDQSIEYRGARLNFCCEKCVAAFQESPRQYAAKANLQLVATEQAKQVGCVFCKKKKLLPDTEMEIGGVKIRFGCHGCMQHVRKAKDRVEAAFNDEQFEKGFVVNAKATRSVP
jgi:YHS domain-containing protein